jgi:hypothetical protein
LTNRGRQPDTLIDFSSDKSMLHEGGIREPLYGHDPLEQPHFLGGRSVGAIRVGGWKLIEQFGTGESELFALAADVSERHDLSDEHPGAVRELPSIDELLSPEFVEQVGNPCCPPPSTVRCRGENPCFCEGNRTRPRSSVDRATVS